MIKCLSIHILFKNAKLSSWLGHFFHNREKGTLNYTDMLSADFNNLSFSWARNGGELVLQTNCVLICR